MSAYAYYPGCSLHGTATEYADSTELVCQTLGIELHELDDWNCCGASSAHAVNPWLALGLVGRNLHLAQQTGLHQLLLPCAACFARFKETQHTLRHDPETAAQVAYVVGAEVPTDLDIEPLLAVLSQPAPLAELRAHLLQPLIGLKLAPYYGCLLTRPPDVTHFDDPEDPQTLDNLLRLIGAEVVDWPGKTVCCGASLALSRPDLVHDLSGQLLSWAEAAGADAIVTVCPMCHSNLDTRQNQIRRAHKGDYHLPIYYITELIGLALGFDPDRLGISRHVTEAATLLAQKLTPVPTPISAPALTSLAGGAIFSENAYEVSHG
ncbi:MAG: CoB--CoM heterodisulfide reductase iron-sulfur subunit B family protein [Anaerolineae bacterium]